jgi:superfamily II DNA or RNA helicase
MSEIMNTIAETMNAEVTTSYLYNRENPVYEKFGVFKNGFTENIPNRENSYNTSDLFPGKFTEVYEFYGERDGHITARWVENALHTHLLKNEYHDYHGAGTEFFKKNAKPLIEPFLDTLEISYKKLSNDEIDRIIRKKYLPTPINPNPPTPLPKSTPSKKKQKKVEEPVVIPKTYTRREYQTDIIQTTVNHFQTNDKGGLVIPCGCGKTMISIWVCLELQANTVLIGVPNTLLLNQWNNSIRIVFPDVPCLLVQSCVSVDKIEKFLTINPRGILITTYASAHKVLQATVHMDEFHFDMKINDEAHHLTSVNIALSKDTKSYVKMLDIPTKKTLSLTATMKHVESIYDETTISNSDISHFGEIIEKHSVLWAIERDIICDYNIQTIIVDEEKLEEQFARFQITEDIDKRLFLGAFSALKSIHDSHSHHLLVYSNSKEHAEKIIQYIRAFLSENYFNITGLYYSDYHSEMKSDVQSNILENFECSTFGIISCVYCLGEGWDFPTLDGEVFAENMTSNIRIVQSALRAIRKDKSNPNKIAKIILPVLNRDDWLENTQNPDLKKVSEVVYQMGLEDETISQKIKAYHMEVGPQSPRPPRRPLDDISLGTYDDEFTKKLRLKTVKRTAFGTSYEKTRTIIAEHNICSKAEYYALCRINNRLPDDPENTFKNRFGGWIEYLSISREKYYDFNTCRIKTREHLLSHPEIKQYYLHMEKVCSELCKLDPMYPPCDLWTDMYSVGDISDIITISTTKKKKVGAV